MFLATLLIDVSCYECRIAIYTSVCLYDIISKTLWLWFFSKHNISEMYNHCKNEVGAEQPASSVTN
jgi:hypothetical protein